MVAGVYFRSISLQCDSCLLMTHIVHALWYLGKVQLLAQTHIRAFHTALNPGLSPF